MIANSRDSNVEQPPRRSGAFGRKDVWALFVGGVLVVLLYLGLAGAEAVRDEASRAAPSGPEPVAAARRVVLIVGSLEVKPTKANGKSWDAFNGLPDPSVTVENLTARSSYRTAKADDTLKATYDLRTVVVREGDEVRILVEDVDVQYHDAIGEHRLRVTTELLEKGEATLEFGQVKRLTLRLGR